MGISVFHFLIFIFFIFRRFYRDSIVDTVQTTHNLLSMKLSNAFAFFVLCSSASPLVLAFSDNRKFFHIWKIIGPQRRGHNFLRTKKNIQVWKNNMWIMNGYAMHKCSPLNASTFFFTFSNYTHDWSKELCL